MSARARSKSDAAGRRSSLARRPNERQQQDAADAKEVCVEQSVSNSGEREGCESDRGAEYEAYLEGAADDPAHWAPCPMGEGRGFGGNRAVSPLVLLSPRGDLSGAGAEAIPKEGSS